MSNNTPASYFERAKALQEMILNAQEDLKQLKQDAIDDLITDGMPKEKAKEIRADLAEVFSIAKVAAKGAIEERKQAEKMARRRRVAEECGVQLDLLSMTAGEVRGRAMAMEQRIGAAFGRLQTGLLEPHVDHIATGSMIGTLDSSGKFQPLDDPADTVARAEPAAVL